MSGFYNINYYEYIIEALTKNLKSNNGNLFEINFSNMCRTCLREAETLNNLNYSITLPQVTLNNSNENKLKLSDMLLKTTGIIIDNFDKYPKQICNECIANLHKSYFFIMQSEKAKKTLANLGELMEFRNEKGPSQIAAEKTNDSSNNIQISDRVSVNKNGKDAIQIAEETTNESNNNIEICDRVNINIKEEICTNDSDKIKDCDDKSVNNNDELRKNENVNDHSSSDSKIKDGINARYPRQKIYNCELCKLQFKTRLSFEIHLKTNHSNERYYKCDKCSLTYEKFCVYRKHQKIHETNPKIYSCSICRKEFFRSDKLKRHYSVHTDERPHKCYICPEAYKATSSLKLHFLNVHPNEKCFKCEKCSAGYNDLARYRRHQKHHNTQKHQPITFLCSFCGKQFLQNSLLQKHLGTHSNKKECAIRKKPLKNKFFLKMHMLTHQTAPMKYPCNICKKSFKTKAKIKTHMNIHLNIRNYKCSECGKRFFSRSSLKTHLSLNHQCCECNKLFSKQKELRSHFENQHKSIQIKYSCNVCKKIFLSKKGMKIHMKKHVNIQKS